MAKPAKPEKAAAAAAEAPAPKSKKKLILIIAAVALLVGGGAGWYFLKGKDNNADASKSETAKTEAAQEPKFISLDAFTVNLQHEDAGQSDQYLQIDMALKVVDPELEEKVKAVLPEIRSKINLLLTSKRPSELVTVVGKKKLAVDIAAEANSVLGFHNGAPAAASAVTDADAPAENGAGGEAASAPVAEGVAPPEPGAEAPTPPPPAAKAEKKGVVDVMFTSFIIQ